MEDSRKVKDDSKTIFTKKLIIEIAVSLAVAALLSILTGFWDYVRDNFIAVTEISVSIHSEKKSYETRHEPHKHVVTNRFDSDGRDDRRDGQSKVSATDGWSIVSDSISLEIKQFGRHNSEPPKATIEAVQDGSFTVHWSYTAKGALFPKKRDAGIEVSARYDEKRAVTVPDTLPTKEITIKGTGKNIEIAQLDTDASIEYIQIALPGKKTIRLSEQNLDTEGFSYTFDPNTGRVMLHYK